MAEAGVAGYESGVWFGLAVPANTPRDVIMKLNAETVKGTKSPEFVKRMTELGYIIMGSSPETMADMNRAEVQRWGPIVRASGAKAD
jgi:tripartite-type tricarboxylate transporter receptor subunit TctC